MPFSFFSKCFGNLRPPSSDKFGLSRLCRGLGKQREISKDNSPTVSYKWNGHMYMHIWLLGGLLERNKILEVGTMEYNDHISSNIAESRCFIGPGRHYSRATGM